MSDETYNGYKNRETWAFDLHWSNDEGLYTTVREWARDFLSRDGEADDEKATDYDLGHHIITKMREFIDEYEDEFGTKLPDELKMYRDEVGSWWRVDETETGASVRESLS